MSLLNGEVGWSKIKFSGSLKSFKTCLITSIEDEDGRDKYFGLL